jgi:hypothetical protein
LILRKIFAYLLLIASGAGFLFSITGIIEIWRYKPVVTNSAIETLDLLDQTLTTTQDGLTIVGQVLGVTTVDVTSLQKTIKALAKSLHDASPTLDSLVNLTSNDFPAALDATKTSLLSAQSSALLIDNVLSAITSIPFLPVSSYKPDVPLNVALAQVSNSLDSLTPSLSAITTSLVEGKVSLGVVELELNKISETTVEINGALNNAQSVVDNYKIVINQLQSRVNLMLRVAKSWIAAIAWILTLILSWSLIVQIGMSLQGIDLLRSFRTIENNGENQNSPVENQ